MTGNNNQHGQKHILALVKGDEKYIFIYDKASETEVIRKLGKFAMNPELSFSWYDAATLRTRMKQMHIDSCEGR